MLIIISIFSTFSIKMKKTRRKSLKELFKPIDEEIRKKNIHFTREEAIADDLFDD